MESYTYLFLFVLQVVFTVVVLLALLHEKRLQKQLEKKNKQLLTELLNLRGEIRAMRRKRPVKRKQPLPVNPTLSNKARKKKRLQTGVAYGRS